MKNEPQHCDACGPQRRYGADVIAGLAEFASTMESAADSGSTDPWPALRERIGGMPTHQLASLVVWLENDPRSTNAIGEAGSHVEAWFKDILSTLYTEFELRAAMQRAEAP